MPEHTPEHLLADAVKVTAPLILAAKGRSRIGALTAYDYQIARILDRAGTDIILIGDSLETVLRGAPTTLTATMPQMLYHCSLVKPAVQRALIAMDMPFGSFHLSESASVKNAIRAVRAGAEAVKIEGGGRSRHIKAIVESEIPVIAHIGLTPQSVHRMGGYKKQRARDMLLADAEAVAAAGAFAVVLEVIEPSIAAEITSTIGIPTIGIGSGSDCDGQILVINDLIGLLHKPSPSFAKQYAAVGETISQAASRYISDVRSNTF
ncbi:MAG: 3-methyl-2-oxobutanoate hydroxymethyltransferase [Spirochaetota bacterium]